MNESWMSILCREKVYEYQKSVVHKSKSESCSVLSHSLLPPWNSPGQNTGVHCLSLLQGIFPTQGLNPGLPHCRQIYHLSHKRSPRIPEWVAYPFSSGSSRPRNWTGVSCIAGKFFTNWAIKEALIYLNFIKENSTTLYVLFLRYTFFFSLQGYNIVFFKNENSCKTILERSKDTYNWFRSYYFFLSLTAPSEKHIKASMLTKTWKNKKRISAAYSFNFLLRQC